MKQITLCVTYTVKPGTAEQFLKEVIDTGIQARIQQEEGCNYYEYYLPVNGKDQIFLLEKWDSYELQQKHMLHPNMTELNAVKDRYTTDLAIEFYYEAEV